MQLLDQLQKPLLREVRNADPRGELADKEQQDYGTIQVECRTPLPADPKAEVSAYSITSRS
jgi:hypothetical protein